jgi:hypothetical protein
MFPTTRAFLRTCMCRTFGRGSVWRSAFGVRRWRFAVVGWGCSSSYSFSTLGLAPGPLAVFQLAAAHLKHVSPMSPIGPICRAFKRVVRGRRHATGPRCPNRGRGRRRERVRLAKRAERQTPNANPSPIPARSSAIRCPVGRVGPAQQFSRHFAR